jgi:urease accessory protein
MYDAGMTATMEASPHALPRIARAVVDVARVGGKSVPVRIAAQQPLKLLNPKNHGGGAWIFSSSFGGGLLAGDHISFAMNLWDEATGMLSTQSSTKVYISHEERVSRQTLRATLSALSTLVVWPDPVVPFAGSRYSQTQRFELAIDANLVLLDWYTSGRHARGERWKAARFETRNEIQVGGRTIARDAIRIVPTDAMLFGGYECFATLFLIGPKLAEASREMVEWARQEGMSRRAPLVFSASAIQEGAFVRVAGRSAEAVSQFLQSCCWIVPELLGDNPWVRKR